VIPTSDNVASCVPGATIVRRSPAFRVNPTPPVVAKVKTPAVETETVPTFVVFLKIE
jgi:hypothetical protein